MRHSTLIWRFACLVGLVGSCSDSDRIVDGKRFLRFGDQCYRIPVWNAALVNASPMWPGFRKRESERSLSLQFSTEDFEQTIEGYRVPLDVHGQRIEGMVTGLFLRTPEDIRQQDENRKRMHVDIWYGLNDYATRTIEPVPEKGFYRIFPLPNGNSWMLVTRLPDEQRRDTHLDKRFWIATCHFMTEKRMRSCTTSVERGALDVTMYTEEANVPLRGLMMNYILRKLETWRVGCT
jgi:hypothetical protein